MHSTYHKEYSARDLYYILIGATHYLESAGMKLDSNEVNKNPKELEDMISMIAIAFAEHRDGPNTTSGYAKNVQGAKNDNGTYDHGLWQINLNDSIYTYLTSKQASNGVNSNIPMFKGKSKSELKDMMYDPFSNAVAAIAIAQLKAGPVKTQGINNWSTVNMIDTSKAFYMEASKDLDTHLAVLDFEKDMYDRLVQESFNFDITGISPPVNPDTIDVEKLNQDVEVIMGRSDYSNLNMVDKFVAKNILEPVSEAYLKTKPYFEKAFKNIKDTFTENPFDIQQQFNRDVYDR